MPIRPQRILVVGAGPCGLVTLRNLIERGSFERVELVERRDDVGGAWYLDNPTHTQLSNTQAPRWPSPAYPGLIGNVLPEFLSFSEFPFPHRGDQNQPFPTLTETHQYLQAFAKPYLESRSIRLNTEVISVTELGPENDSRPIAGDGDANDVDERSYGWKVVMRDWNDRGKSIEEIWDAVVIAQGWYDIPAWPDTPGLEELRENDLARHAKWWRGPDGYEDKKVLVVGNANSSNDMAAQLAPLVVAPIYQSIRRPAFPGFPSLPDERIKMVAPIKRFGLRWPASDAPTPKVAAELTDGTALSDIDVVLFGSGYKPRGDFIYVRDPREKSMNNSDTQPPTTKSPPLAPIIMDDIQPHRIPWLHLHVLYAYNPSLAFVGSALAFTPFTIADCASTWLTLAWTNELPYPGSPAERLLYEAERLKAMEEFRATLDCPSSLMVYNVLGYHEQDYATRVKGEIKSVRRDLADLLPVWSDERTKARDAMFLLKLKALEYARDKRNENIA